MNTSHLLDAFDESELGRWHAILIDGSFEEVTDALEQVVARLEAGRLPLDLAITCYELGAALADRGDQLLDEAELRVSLIDIGTGNEDDDENEHAGLDSELDTVDATERA